MGILLAISWEEFQNRGFLAKGRINCQAGIRMVGAPDVLFALLDVKVPLYPMVELFGLLEQHLLKLPHHALVSLVFLRCGVQPEHLPLPCKLLYYAVVNLLPLAFLQKINVVYVVFEVAATQSSHYLLACDRVSVRDNLFRVEFLIAYLLLLHLLKQIKHFHLINTLHTQNVLLEVLYDTYCQADHRALLFDQNIVDVSLHISVGEGIQVERNKPLEEPSLITDMRLRNFAGKLRQLSSEQLPEEAAVELDKREGVLIKANQEQFLMKHQSGEHLEGVIVVVTSQEQVGSNEIQSLRITKFGKVKSEFLQKTVKSLLVGLFIKVLFIGERAGHIFLDLLKT